MCVSRSESAVELRGRKLNGAGAGAAGDAASSSSAAAAGSALLFRKSMPPPASSHLEVPTDQKSESDFISQICLL